MIELAKKFGAEEEGAAMIEYTVLIGIITVAVIVSIISIGNWVGLQWGNLKANLKAS